LKPASPDEPKPAPGDLFAMTTATRQRTNIVSGARSGMGKATVELLRSRGERVLGIDLTGSDIPVDLATDPGRHAAIAAVKAACPRGVDALILCAGLGGGMAPGEDVVSVNYFGAVDLATGLRPLLAAGDAPRVVAISSSASLLGYDAAIVEACLAGDEPSAREMARAKTPDDTALRAGPIYAASKRALTRWIRRTSVLPEWAGTGILLNGVSPGLVQTPMTLPMLGTEEGRAILAKVTPRAVREAAIADDLAHLVTFLASAQNRYLVGQVPLSDGGTDVLLRGDDVF
jgi:NAD(P)-dependent dehydrogenase (short-subunit alcohol dehydrogenase family)